MKKAVLTRTDLQRIADEWQREAEHSEIECIRNFGSADDQPHIRSLKRAASALRVLEAEMYLAGKPGLPGMKRGGQ